MLCACADKFNLCSLFFVSHCMANTYVHIRSRYKIHFERSQASAGEKPKDRRKEIHILFVLFSRWKRWKEKRDSESEWIFWVHGTISLNFARNEKKWGKRYTNPCRKKITILSHDAKIPYGMVMLKVASECFGVARAQRVCCAANRTSKVQ